MGGRLLDWLGAGVAGALPDPVLDMPGRIVPGSTAFYWAKDTQHLFVYDEAGPSWFDIDMAAVTAVSTESIQDMIAAFLVAGTGITLTYNDVGNILTIASSVTQYTDEMAQDTIAALIAAGTQTGLTITYDDALNKLSFAISTEYIQDLIGALFAAGTDTGLTVTYDDAGNAINVAVSNAYVDARADARIAAASIDALTDVDTTTVAPTDTQVLAYQASSGKWKPATLAGGSSYPANSVPAAATFALASGDATNLTLTDDSDAGLLVDTGAPVAGDKGRIAYKTLSNKALAWDLQVYLDYIVDPTSGSGVGIYLQDSIGGKAVTFEPTRESGNTCVVHWASLATFGGAIALAITFPKKIRWLRVASDGTTLTFSISDTGKNWVTFLSEGITAWLANKPDRIGFGVSYGRTTGVKNMMTIQRFVLTGPAV